MRMLLTWRAMLALPIAVVLVSCGEPTAPAAEPALPGALGSASQAGLEPAAAQLLPCPQLTGSAATRWIGPAGGVLEHRGHRLSVPPGAVVRPREFTLEEKASPHLEVAFRAGGHPSYQFRRPVQLTLSYARCPETALARPELRVYFLSPVVGAVLQDLGGVNDTSARTVTATTDHLSDYAVGTPF